MSAMRTNRTFRPLRGDTIGELERATKRFDKRLRRAARIIAGDDRDYAADLYQAAMTELWELDPARFDPDEDGYLWQSMINRMLMVQRVARRVDPTRPPWAVRIP